MVCGIKKGDIVLAWAGIDMPNPVHMSTPEHLKRELGELLVERKRLNDLHTVVLYPGCISVDLCVDPETYIQAKVAEKAHSDEWDKVYHRIRVVEDLLLQAMKKSVGESEQGIGMGVQ